MESGELTLVLLTAKLHVASDVKRFWQEPV